jgi:hypothetical protein
VTVSLGAKAVELELVARAKWGRGPGRTSTPTTAPVSAAPPSIWCGAAALVTADGDPAIDGSRTRRARPAAEKMPTRQRRA